MQSFIDLIFNSFEILTIVAAVAAGVSYVMNRVSSLRTSQKIEALQLAKEEVDQYKHSIQLCDEDRKVLREELNLVREKLGSAVGRLDELSSFLHTFVQNGGNHK